MKTIILIFLFLSISIIGYSQQHSYDYLVNSYCQKISMMDFGENTKREIMQINNDISKKVQAENQDTINSILRKIQSENDTLSERDALIIFSKKYLYDIIYHCNGFLKMSRLTIEACPKETNSLQYITLRINKYLSQHTDFTYTEVLDSTQVKIFEYSMDISNQINEDYDMGLILPKTIINYLLHKSDIYAKAWLFRQSMYLFE